MKYGKRLLLAAVCLTAVLMGTWPAFAAGTKSVYVLKKALQTTMGEDYETKLYYNSSGFVSKADIDAMSYGSKVTLKAVFSYDKKGNMKKVVTKNTPYGKCTCTFTYKNGKVVKRKCKYQTDPDTQTTTYTWKGRTFTARWTDEDGVTTVTKGQLDALGRLKSALVSGSVTSDTSKETCKYDKKGFLKSISANGMNTKITNTVRNGRLARAAAQTGNMKSTVVFTFERMQVPSAFAAKVRKQQNYIILNWARNWHDFQYPLW